MDKEKILDALSHGELYARFCDLPNELQDDPDVIFAYAKSSVEQMYKKKKDFFRSSRENMKRLMETDISLNVLEDEDLEDIEYMKIALIYEPSRIVSLWYLGHTILLKKVVDKEMALYLVRYQGGYLQYLSEFQDDDEVVLKAISKSKGASMFASKILQFVYQNIIFESAYDVSEVEVQSTIHSIGQKMEELKNLQNDVALLMSKITEVTNEVEAGMQKVYKVKQKGETL